MYDNIDLFRTASAMAQHAGRRQALVAQNIANADTPAYRAQGIPAFQEIYRADAVMKATRPQHFAGATPGSTVAATSHGEPSPNGNTVSLEEELLNAVSVAREHNRALAVYRHGMTLLRTALGRG
jgi:flagellar basal-body rod protein FlgB